MCVCVCVCVCAYKSPDKADYEPRQTVPLPCRRVQNPDAEGLLPEFDLAQRVGRKIALQKYRRAIVLCVVDVTDFDGSLPRYACPVPNPSSAFAGRSIDSLL